MSIELASGGTVDLGINVDLLRLDKADRAFLFELIDKVHAYRDNRRREQERESSDEEVPF